MPCYQVDYDQTVTFRTSIDAPDPDAAYDQALASADKLAGEVIAFHAVDEFSVVIRDPALAFTHTPAVTA